MRWQKEAELAVCPLTELGFLRISTQPSFGATAAEARTMLRDWKRAKKPRFISCDLDSLDSELPPTGAATTDYYLANLAAKHGMQPATLDESIGHKSTFVIPA